MVPNDAQADAAQRRSIQLKRRGRVADAAWAMTAAAHLTTAARPEHRARRALCSVRLWQLAGRPAWSRDMARAFSHDRCLPAGARRELEVNAQGSDALGISFVGAGAGAANVAMWAIVVGCAWVAWKAARYLVTGHASAGGSASIPPAWRVHG
jgi:hypothetical protein